jgi:hypothetical protein
MPNTKPAPSPEPEPFDASAMLAEIRAEGRPFTLNGETFTLPAPTAWPDEAFAAATNNDPVTASRLILGDEEYARFSAAGGNALFLQRLVEKLHGSPMGESSGSSPS